MKKKWWQKIVGFVLGNAGHLLALGVLTVIYWLQVQEIAYAGTPAGASDFYQYVHYTVYEGRHMEFPLKAWNHLWHKGAPRILDTSWVHFYLIQLMIGAIGLYRAIWLYPLMALWGVVVFSYWLFYEASRSRLVALGLAVVVAMSEGLSLALVGVGMGTSAISQMFLPAQLYFLARFFHRGNKKNLVLAGVVGVLGIFSHGLNMSFFGLLPAGLFILFSLKGKERFVNKRTIKNAAVFSLVVLTVGALAFWPGFVVNTFTGGGQAAMGFAEGNEAELLRDVFKDMAEVTSSGLWWGLGIGLVVWLVAWWRRKKKVGRITPYLAVGGFVFLWFLSYYLGINRYSKLFFTWRIFWTVPVIGGMVAAAMLRPLSERLKVKKLVLKIGAWLGMNGVKVAILVVVAGGALAGLRQVSLKGELDEYRRWVPRDLKQEVEDYYSEVIDSVDVNDWNHRLWTADWNFNQRWALVSEMPLAEGYFHFATKWSAVWEGWAGSLLGGGSWENKDMSWGAAVEQTKFFIDWYGINSLWVCSGNQTYCRIWEYFEQEDNSLIEKRLKVKRYSPGTLFTIKDKYTSGVVEPSESQVIGFVGSKNGYRGLMLNLATLNLNSSKLVVLQLGESVKRLSDEVLADLDGVVIYDQRKQGRLDGAAWKRLKKFVERGGKVWVETGGNSIMREKSSLPELLPVKGTRYGDLGKSWQVEGDWVKEIGVNKLEPLVYEDDVWQLSYSQNDWLREGAKVVLSQAGYPIGVEKEIGKGRVLWTGVNWFFRQEAHKENDLREIQPVKLMLEKMWGKFDRQVVEGEVEFVSPRETKIVGKGFRGVVNKTIWWPGWEAVAKTNDKEEELRIYMAGPGLMYVVVPEEMRDEEVEVRFEYKGARLDWICLGITVIATGIVVVYLITGRVVLLERLRKRLKRKSKVKSKSWWDDEED